MSGIATSQSTDAESLRHEYEPQERQVRSIALLFWFNACTNALMALSLAVWLCANGPGGADGLLVVLFVTITCLSFAALPAITAWQLGGLSTAGHVLGIIGGCFMLFGVPIGTLVGVLVLRALLSEQGKFVFSQAYRDAVTATPQIKIRASRVVVALLALVILLVIAVLISLAVVH